MVVVVVVVVVLEVVVVDVVVVVLEVVVVDEVVVLVAISSLIKSNLYSHSLVICFSFTNKRTVIPYSSISSWLVKSLGF